MEYQHYFDHFSRELSPEIHKYATDSVFKTSRYMFTRREGRHQYGYCTHCRNEHKTNGFSHNTYVDCPTCGSHCFVKASGRGRKYMFDEAFFVYYEKSIINPQVIVARGIYAVRDYSFDYHNVETQYLEKAWYIFEMGNSVMLKQDGYYSSARTMKAFGGICRSSSVHSLFSRHNSSYYKRVVATAYSRESIREAVMHTPFQYSTWESYVGEISDMVKLLDLYSRYPCVEYLTKLGFVDLVLDKLQGGNTYSAINWRGKTLQRVLRLSKKDIYEIKASKVRVDPLFLRLLQISKKDGSNLSVNEISVIKRNYSCGFKVLQKVLRHTTLRKAHAYFEKQYNQKNQPQGSNKSRHWYSEYQVLSTWRDYIADCVRLGMNLTSERVLFPTNLYRAHQNTIKQIKLKGDKLLNQKISARLNALKKYCFEALGLIIRPAASSLELIEEGKALQHCVGTYADRYAKGEINLFIIRKADEPTKPYFTVEIQKDKVIQVRGLKNCQPSEDVAKFIEAFTKKRLSKKNIKIAVSA